MNCAMLKLVDKPNKIIDEYGVSWKNGSLKYNAAYNKREFAYK